MSRGAKSVRRRWLDAWVEAATRTAFRPATLPTRQHSQPHPKTLDALSNQARRAVTPPVNRVRLSILTNAHSSFTPRDPSSSDIPSRRPRFNKANDRRGGCENSAGLTQQTEHATHTYRRLTGSLAGERPTGRGRREFSTQQKAPAR